MGKKRGGGPGGPPTTSEPIRRMKDIRAISDLLYKNPRNHLLWTMGINNGLRAGDLVQIKIEDVIDLKPGEQFTITEGKTTKTNIVMVNKSVYKSLKRYLDERKLSDNEYLFPSRVGNGHITRPSVGRMIGQWAAAVNLKGNYAAHTMRKTWAYQNRTRFGVSWEIICKRLNHSNPAVTMRYLGLQSEEVEEVLMNEIS